MGWYYVKTRYDNEFNYQLSVIFCEKGVKRSHNWKFQFNPIKNFMYKNYSILLMMTNKFQYSLETLNKNSFEVVL